MPSTAIRRFEYDPGRGILSVWFEPRGYRYDYDSYAHLARVAEWSAHVEDEAAT